MANCDTNNVVVIDYDDDLWVAICLNQATRMAGTMGKAFLLFLLVTQWDKQAVKNNRFSICV